ncbi:MAG TPA: flagellar hook-basal body complex protein FliE [Candidatus Acidoferrales bacterium]|nr:flagellar hook-basal body complex protein FliE [Candidatus Acidoferrales bacterium]
MTVTPLEPDAPLQPDAPLATPDPGSATPLSGAPAASFGTVLQSALSAADGALQSADSAERAFAAGRGGLQEMMVERAQADVLLSIATSAASRTAQAVSTILGMQI